LNKLDQTQSVIDCPASSGQAWQHKPATTVQGRWDERHDQWVTTRPAVSS